MTSLAVVSERLSRLYVDRLGQENFKLLHDSQVVRDITDQAESELEESSYNINLPVQTKECLIALQRSL